MRCWAAWNTALDKARQRPRLLLVLGLGLLVFLQRPGWVSSDTKLDLLLAPAEFLAKAAQSYTPLFTLGGVQNQAYGYLFPQGAFFALLAPLPDWVVLRAWWWLTLSVGATGTYTLFAQLLPQQVKPWQLQLGALVYVLSPHTLSTLTTISSETWPQMLAPWLCWAAFTSRFFLLPGLVFCLGAVNATATLAALIPMLFFLRRPKLWHTGKAPLAGGAAIIVVCCWWLGPLLLLGKYAPPFVDYIETARVTTRWLNLAEILRGTTSWAPFADAERFAGTLLASNWALVAATLLVAVVGLVSLPQLPRPLWWLFWLGLIILGTSHTFVAVQDFLDGAGVAFRNVHKFDLLVRLPLAAGVALSASRLKAGHLQLALASVLVATAPAWGGNLLPLGSWQHLPAAWFEAAAWLNSNAAGTRTLIAPPAPFARQTWGWTRDEVLQPLLRVPWATRDAIPIVNPEAINGLDGIFAALESDAVTDQGALTMLTQQGFGVLVTRADLADAKQTRLAAQLASRAARAGWEQKTFGDITISFNRAALTAAPGGVLQTPLPQANIVGNGAVIPLVAAATGANLAFQRLSSAQAAKSNAPVLLTDTPALQVRNFGATAQNTSAVRAAGDQDGRSLRKQQDYATTTGVVLAIKETGGKVLVSSAQSNPDGFLGADPERSATAAVDHELSTSWYPAAGQTGVLTLKPETATGPGTLVLRTTGAVGELTIRTPQGSFTTGKLAPGVDHELAVPEQSEVNILTPVGVGITEAHLREADITRWPHLAATASQPSGWFFQQLLAPAGVLRRSFTTLTPQTVNLNSSDCRLPVTIDNSVYFCGQKVQLAAGEHTLATKAGWVLLGELPQSFGPQVYPTNLAFLAGLNVTGQAVDYGAGQLGIIPPAGTRPAVTGFAAQRPYQLSLALGLTLAVSASVLGIWFNRRRRRGVPATELLVGPPRFQPVVLPLFFFLAAGPAGGLGSILGLAARALKLHPAIGGLAPFMVALLWLVHAPWTAAIYAGDSPWLQMLCAWAVTFWAQQQPLRRLFHQQQTSVRHQNTQCNH